MVLPTSARCAKLVVAYGLFTLSHLCCPSFSLTALSGGLTWQAPKHCERLFYHKLRDAVHSFELRGDVKHKAEVHCSLGFVCVLFSV
jgi:hypothetical protein